MFTGKTDAQGRPLKVGRELSGKPDLLLAAYRGELDTVRKCLAYGDDVDMTDEATGLSALHIAAGTNNAALARLLVEEHQAAFFADGLGRWPSLIAAECQTDDALSDYIVQKEADFCGRKSA